ncbi:copper amine oxidase N-terminal domain-containing protein [Paenibacillus sinopodophylli]|uniref:copper amine oxidase N-terminal domain-containing protein n=1 Tax=Paenibacillus sinopodophylli TaxID=1837342 RepID=UPI00110CAAEC|nr:copper amine oxidase N-terminal domain-containing protein [Paenibacillus sinopodophylli]
MMRMIMLLLCMLVAVPTVSVAAAQTRPDYRIVIDNKELVLDNPPYLHAGTTMVPFRPLFTRLGLEVTWNAKSKQITASNGERKIVLTIGSRKATINGVEQVMPLAPVVQGGVTYVPLRFVGDASGGDVELYGDGLNVVWVLSAKQNELFSAIIMKDLREAERLLAIGADPTVMIGPLGPEGFLFADDSIPMIELFLKYGMDVNYFAPEWWGQSLLQNAVSNGRPEIVEFLLEAGADPELAVQDGWTPLMYAHYWRNEIESGYTHIIDESMTPTVEDYDAIIVLLEGAINKIKEQSAT